MQKTQKIQFHKKDPEETSPLNLLFEKIRVNATPLEQRQKYMQQALEILEKNMIIFANCPIQSRVMQQILKNGTDEQKKAISSKLLDVFQKIAQAKYGRFVAVEIINSLKNEEKDELIKSKLIPIVPKMVTNACSNIALNMIYSKSEIKIQNLIINYVLTRKITEKDNFFIDEVLAAPQQLPIYLDNVIRLLTKCENKMMLGSIVCIQIIRQLYYLLFRLPLQEQKDQILNALYFLQDIEPDQFLQLIDTEEGAEVACYIYATLTAKAKKQILLQLKPKLEDIITDKYACLVFIVIPFFTDDITQITQIYENLCEKHLVELQKNKHTSQFLLLCSGRFQSIKDNEKFSINEVVRRTVSNSFLISSCKKPVEKKQAEMNDFAIKLFKQITVKQHQDILNSNTALNHASLMVKYIDILGQDVALEILKGKTEKDYLIVEEHGHFSTKRIIEVLTTQSKKDLLKFATNITTERNKLRLKHVIDQLNGVQQTKKK